MITCNTFPRRCGARAFGWRALSLAVLLCAASITTWAGDRIAPSGNTIHNDAVSGGAAAVGTATHVLWGAVGQPAVGNSFAPSGVINHGWPRLDKTPPVVTEVRVEDGLTVDVTFSKPMGTGVTTAANYTVSGSGQGTLADTPDSVAHETGHTYRLTWVAPNEMFDGGDIVITVSNVEDYAGNPMGTPNSDTDIGGAVGEAPEALCQNITITLPGPITVDAEDLDGGSTDNVDVVEWLIDGEATKTFTNADLGDTEVTLRVLDAAGNYDECQATVTVQKGTATVTLDNLLHTYNGSARAASATTDPVGLTVNFTYTQDGDPVTPVNAGLYDVLAEVEDANYAGSASDTLEIIQAPVTITLVDVVKVWDGTTEVALAPANFSFQGLAPGESLEITQTEGAFDSSDIGEGIPVTADLDGFIVAGPDTDLANYALPTMATGFGDITDKIVPVVSWPTATSIVFGEALDQSTLEGGSAEDPNAGVPVPGDFAFADESIVPGAAGVYNADVTFTPEDDATYQSRQTQVPVTVHKAPATVLLDNLTQVYDGSPKHASATTDPPGLTVVFTYDGAPAAPTIAGDYVVAATIDDTNYTGSATDTLVIAKAPPTITTLPTASDIVYGQALSASALSGGLASVDGVFAFTNPEFIPEEGGMTNQSVTFTPTHTQNYAPTTVEIVVTVTPLVTAVGETEVHGLFGGQTTFTVAVSGAVGTLSYQWYRVTDDKALAPIPDAHAPSLTLTDLTEADAGDYQCEVYDTGSGLSAWAPLFTLTVSTGLPGAGVFGLALAAAFTALAGAVALRRKQ